MGKCLSCCEEPESSPTQNGHSTSCPPSHKAVALKTAVTDKLPKDITSSSLNKYRVDPEVTGSGDAGANTGSCHGNGNGDTAMAVTAAKMFSPYPKLPPIRKPSNAEAKQRLSLTMKDYSEHKITMLFDSYRDPGDDEDCLQAEGIEKLCMHLGVRPEEFRVLVLAWKFNAETMCRFTRAEFFGGCKKLRVDSIKGIQSRFPEMLAEVQLRENFKDLYRWTFKFGLDSDTGQRTLPVEMAISLWGLVFTQNEPRILKRWLAFLEKHPNIRGIPRDTWDMFLNFAEVVGDDLSTYDDTEAWPSLFDDFVEYENDCQNQNVTEEKPAKEYEVQV